MMQSTCSFRLIRSYLAYNPRLEQCFSLTPNQPAVLSAMAYKPIQPKRTGCVTLDKLIHLTFRQKTHGLSKTKMSKY